LDEEANQKEELEAKEKVMLFKNKLKSKTKKKSKLKFIDSLTREDQETPQELLKLKLKKIER